MHKPISLSLTSRQANTKHFKLLPQTTTIASSDPQNNQWRSWDPHWRWGECRAPSQWFLSEAGCGLCWRGEWVVACGCVCGGVGSIIKSVSKNINKQHKNLWKKSVKWGWWDGCLRGRNTYSTSLPYLSAILRAYGWETQLPKNFLYHSTWWHVYAFTYNNNNTHVIIIITHVITTTIIN